MFTKKKYIYIYIYRDSEISFFISGSSLNPGFYISGLHCVSQIPCPENHLESLRLTCKEYDFIKWLMDRNHYLKGHLCISLEPEAIQG